jgi:hypothetical protein
VPWYATDADPGRAAGLGRTGAGSLGCGANGATSSVRRRLARLSCAHSLGAKVDISKGKGDAEDDSREDRADTPPGRAKMTLRDRPAAARG